MRGEDRTVENVLARIGSSAHGVATRRELLRAGLSAKQIDRRISSGALIPQYRGVYRIGHQAQSVEAHYLAAVRACGDGALLSGCAGAHLFGLVKGPSRMPEVTAPTERHVPGIKTHRARRGERDATTWRGVPVTTVARTLVDIAGALGFDELARACHEAGVRYGTTPSEVAAVLARRPRSAGAQKLRRILEGDVRVTLSALEKRFLGRLAEEGLELPVTNRPAGGRRVDCRWPERRLTVELDSYRFHHSRHSWEQDRRREREARARGDEFRRYTWGDVFEQPRLMLAELYELLRAPS